MLHFAAYAFLAAHAHHSTQLQWLSTTLSNCRFSSMPANAAYAAGGVLEEELSEEELGGSNDTIVALSSGAGRSAVAVVRISGPQAGASGALPCRLNPLVCKCMYSLWVCSADAALLAMLKPGSRLPEARVAVRFGHSFVSS